MKVQVSAGFYNVRKEVRIDGVMHTERKDGTWRQQGTSKKSPLGTEMMNRIFDTFAVTSPKFDRDAFLAGTFDLPE